MSYFSKCVCVRNGEVEGITFRTRSWRRCSQAAREGRRSHIPHPLLLPCGSLHPQGRQLESVRAEAAEKGDVGLVAENSRSTQRLMLPPPALTASGVFAKFQDIARLTGSAVSGAGCLPTSPDPLFLTPGTQIHACGKRALVRLFGAGSLQFCVWGADLFVLPALKTENLLLRFWHLIQCVQCDSNYMLSKAREGGMKESWFFSTELWEVRVQGGREKVSLPFTPRL